MNRLKHFHSVFAPAAAKFEGYIDVTILKLRTLIQGPKPPAGIDATLKDKNFQVLLFDAV